MIAWRAAAQYADNDDDEDLYGARAAMADTNMHVFAAALNRAHFHDLCGALRIARVAGVPPAFTRAVVGATRILERMDDDARRRVLAACGGKWEGDAEGGMDVDDAGSAADTGAPAVVTP